MSGRLNYYFRQKVTEAELDLGFTLLETATRSLMTDMNFVGVKSGGVVTQHTGIANLTVDIAGDCILYDKLGQRVAWGPVQNVDVSQDESAVTTAVTGGGNSKIVSVFAKFKRVLTDPRTDGNSLTVYFDEAESFEFVVRQGSEAVSPVAPPLDAEYILLCDITRTLAAGTILNGAISTTRREDMPVGAASVDYAGGGTWADGGTNPTTTVEAQLDKIVADLAATTGDVKIGAPTRTQSPVSLASGSVGTQTVALLTALNAFENQKHAASGLASLNGSSRLVELPLNGIVSMARYDRAGAGNFSTASLTPVDVTAYTVSLTVAVGDIVEYACKAVVNVATTSGAFQVVIHDGGSDFVQDGAGFMPATQGTLITVTGQYVAVNAGTLTVRAQVSAENASHAVTVYEGSNIYAKVIRP